LLGFFLSLVLALDVVDYFVLFPGSVVIWQEFGKDLSGNLENRLIVFPLRRVENLTSKGGVKNEAKTGVRIGFDQNGWKRRLLMSRMWNCNIS
jgi:hypothetical protein